MRAASARMFLNEGEKEKGGQKQDNVCGGEKQEKKRKRKKEMK